MSDPEKSLETLGRRVREGWAKLHPVTEKQLDAVHEALAERDRREQAEQEAAQQRQGQAQDHDRDKEQDHGHSH
jgi:hypothetical protein